VTRLVVYLVVIWELILRIEDLVGVHDAATLLEIGHGFVVVTGIDLENSSVQIIVLFVEDVLLVVVCFFCLLVVGFFIRYISSLSRIGASFQLLVEPG